MIPAAYSDVHKIDERVFDVNSGLCDFAEKGEWKGVVDILAGIVKENFAVRDSVEGEKVVQSTLVALLTAAKGPYFVTHEREAGGGFYDLALAPRLARWPDIGHAALIELKYVKAGDPPPTPEALAKIKADAIDQLDKYSADPVLVAKWHLCRSNETGDSLPPGRRQDGGSLGHLTSRPLPSIVLFSCSTAGTACWRKRSEHVAMRFRAGRRERATGKEMLERTIQ